MTVLGQLLAGEGPPVLQTCRFEGLGGSLYGREAIAERLAALRSGFTPALVDLETPRLGVWIDGEHAIVADLVHGQVQRLWLLGEAVGLVPLPAVHIPLDADLAQATRAVRFEGCDHPDLDEGDASRLSRAVGAWPNPPPARPRPIVLRAASIGSTVFGLVRLEGELPDGPPLCVGCNGLVWVQGETVSYRQDGAEPAQAWGLGWSPRL
jgi:hypothetical protein